MIYILPVHMFTCTQKLYQKERLSTAYPPLIHPIKPPLNRGTLLYTSDGKTGKLQGKYKTLTTCYRSGNGQDC